MRASCDYTRSLTRWRATSPPHGSSRYKRGSAYAPSARHACAMSAPARERVITGAMSPKTRERGPRLPPPGARALWASWSSDHAPCRVHWCWNTILLSYRFELTSVELVARHLWWADDRRLRHVFWPLPVGPCRYRDRGRRIDEMVAQYLVLGRLRRTHPALAK